MSKWEKTNLWLKQHYLCVMAWLVVVLIALIVVMAGNDKELVGYFSFACSLSGILLAIVVIIHTWIDSADTRTVLTEVKSRLTDIRGDVVKTEGTVKQLKTDFSQEINKIVSNIESKSETSFSKPDKKKGKSRDNVKDELISNLEKQVFATEVQYLLAITTALALSLTVDEPDMTSVQARLKKHRDIIYNRVKSKSPDSDDIAWIDSLISKNDFFFPPIEESQQSES